MTAEQLAELPAMVNLVTAGRAFGLGRDATYQLAKAGEFPCEVLSLGRFLRVRKADLMRELHLNMDGTPLSGSSAPPRSAA